MKKIFLIFGIGIALTLNNAAYAVFEGTGPAMTPEMQRIQQSSFERFAPQQIDESYERKELQDNQGGQAQKEIDKKLEQMESSDVLSGQIEDEKLYVTIEKVEFPKSEVFSEDELQQFAAPIIGRTVSIEEINKVVEAISRAYVENDYFTSRAYLPEQNVANGVLTISLYEGRVGKINVENNKWTRSSYITNRIDTKEGDLFIAIKGEKNDGHLFVADVLAKGANLVVVDHLIEDVPENRQIVVSDTIKAYGQIGAYNRSLFKGVVIGLTGSAGKTTTKEEIKFALSKFGKVYATSGNFNNHIGVPATLCNMDMSADYAIVEMGMSAKGEIENLVSYVEPDVAIITNVYPMHIEFFPNFEGIAEAKAEIFKHLKKGGLAIINEDTNFASLLEKRALENGKSAIVLIPEIGLTSQAVDKYRAVFGKFIAQGNLILVIFALMRLHDLHREVARRHAGKTQGGKQIARFNKNIDQIQILDAGSLRAVRNSEHHGVLLVALHTDSGHVAVGPRVGHGRK